MKLDIDTRDKVFSVAVAPKPRPDPDSGGQRMDKETGLPQWLVEVFVREPGGADKDTVIVLSDQVPDVDPGDEVVLKGLYAYEWTAGKGRRGINYKALAIEPVYED